MTVPLLTLCHQTAPFLQQRVNVLKQLEQIERQREQRLLAAAVSAPHGSSSPNRYKKISSAPCRPLCDKRRSPLATSSSCWARSKMLANAAYSSSGRATHQHVRTLTCSADKSISLRASGFSWAWYGMTLSPMQHLPCLGSLDLIGQPLVDASLVFAPEVEAIGV